MANYTLPAAYPDPNLIIGSYSFRNRVVYVPPEEEAAADNFLVRYWGCTKTATALQVGIDVNIVRRPDVDYADVTTYANVAAAQTALNTANTVDGIKVSPGQRVLYTNLTGAPNIYTITGTPSNYTLVVENLIRPSGGDFTRVKIGTYASQTSNWDGTKWNLTPVVGATAAQTTTDKGNWDASGNVFPSGSAINDQWTVSVAGTPPGPPAVTLNVGDKIKALVANASTTTAASNWSITPAPTGGAVDHVVLTATQAFAANTTFHITTPVAGTTITRTEGTPTLGTSLADFRSREAIKLTLNGLSIKEQVTWVSTAQFTCPLPIGTNDVFYLESP